LFAKAVQNNTPYSVDGKLKPKPSNKRILCKQDYLILKVKKLKGGQESMHNVMGKVEIN